MSDSSQGHGWWLHSDGKWYPPETMRPLRKANGEVDSDWLKHIYDGRVERFISDNNRIWTSGSLLVPLSLAPFLTLTDSTSIRDFVVLGIASTILIVFWHVIAERHRVFQEDSASVITEIENIAGFHSINTEPPKCLKVGRARRIVVLLVPAVWVVDGLWRFH